MSEWLEAGWAGLKSTWQWIRKPKKPNFIFLHYTYISCWAIAGSILMYGPGGIAYIDALFFGAGASTQSGLNTVNVNQLNTAQQFFLYIIPMFTNPIVIHSMVVFARLYWFEKRFQHIVKEAMNWRGTRTRSRTNTHGNEEKGQSAENKDVRNKSIVVLHDHARNTDSREVLNSGAAEKEPDEGSSSSSNAPKDDNNNNQIKRPLPLLSERSKREVLFADQIMNSPSQMSPSIGLPEPRTTEHHIEFLERQRNPKDKGALRIPGPRDFDRGEKPERVDERDGTEHEAEYEAQENSQSNEKDAATEEDQPPARDLSPRRSTNPSRRNITIDESARPLPQLQPQQSRVTFRRTATNASRALTEGGEPIRPLRTRPRSNTLTSFFKSTSTRHDDPVPYLSWQPTIGRNSAFVDLTEEQREELGGIEYRSLKTLALILITYFFSWHLLGVVLLLPWIVLTNEWGSVVDSDGVNRTWWGIFTPGTLFNDLGFTLTPDSFASFNTAVLPLLFGSILIVVGNTGFPCMLRLWIWLVQKLVPKQGAVWEELRFLLDHPRRCFTLLFPSAATWVLFAILVLLNGVDLFFYIILDLNDSTVTSVAPGFRVLNGIFQATSTRTSGTAVVNLADLHPGIQVSYLIMMYISVFPIAISMRRTNVYEERSLGVYNSADEDEEDSLGRSYIGAHLRKQLSFDLWFIFLGLFVIAIAEGSRIADPTEPDFNIFSCLFEIVSAYGTVGLSLGYPNVDTSFSGQFTVVSKLVIIAMMIRGRHRGLPYQLDRAILLPSEKLNQKEDQDATRRNRRFSSSSFQAPTVIQDEPAEAHTTGREEEVANHRPKQQLGKMLANLAWVDSAVKDEIKNGLDRPKSAT